MINMHHCRFQNTLEALRECCETLEYDDASDLSESEQNALAHLMKLCEKLGRFYAQETTRNV